MAGILTCASHPQVPLLSQTSVKLDKEALDAYVKRVQYGGDEVVKAKNGGGSATLSMAAAGARFADALLSGLDGSANKKEPAFIESTVVPGVKYFATFVEFGVRTNVAEWGLCSKRLDHANSNRISRSGTA